MVLHPALGEYDQWHPSDNKSGSYFRLIPKGESIAECVAFEELLKISRSAESVPRTQK
jgi:hypothetical protein